MHLCNIKIGGLREKKCASIGKYCEENLEMQQKKIHKIRKPSIDDFDFTAEKKEEK